MELKELNLTEEQLEGVNKIIQSETDKVRTEYSKKIKDLESKLPKSLVMKKRHLMKELRH